MTVGAIPNSELVEDTKRGSVPLVRWMNTVRDTVNPLETDVASLSATVSGLAGDIWRGKQIHTAQAYGAATMATLGYTITQGGGGGGAPTFSAIVPSTTDDTRTRSSVSVATSTVAASTAYQVNGTAEYWFGNTALRGGFRIEFEFAIGNNASMRMSVGISATAAGPTMTSEPSAHTNCIMMGFDSTDTNHQIMHNDAAGTCTKIDLGASFPINATTALYRLVLTATANASTVAYAVTRIDTGATASGTLSTNLPSNTTFMYWNMSVGNAAQARAASILVYHVLGEL